MNAYRIKKERERLIFSTVSVAVVSFFLLSVLYLIGLLKFEDFNNYSGPIKVTFGNPESLNEPEIPVNEPIIEKEIPEPIVEEEVIEPIEEIREPIKEEIIKTPEKPLEPVVQPKPPVPKKAEPLTPPKPVDIIQKGDEKGNSHETTFESTTSDIGRRAYFPIYEYMPLPKVISRDLFSRINGDVSGFGIEGESRRIFLKYYRDSVDSYTLDNDIPMNERPQIWKILEIAGYNLDSAEYKNRKNLKSVIISFEITGIKSGRISIANGSIQASSGYKDIDEAVLHGFKQSTYSNSSSDSVKGRFKYDFK